MVFVAWVLGVGFTVGGASCMSPVRRGTILPNDRFRMGQPFELRDTVWNPDRLPIFDVRVSYDAYDP